MRKSYRFCGAIALVLGLSTVASAGQGRVEGLRLSDTTVESGATVSATATGTSPCGAVHIDWGDGTAITYATETLPVTQTHTYKHGGTFNLRAQGMGNCTGEATARIVVQGPPPPPPTLTRLTVSDTEVEPQTPVVITAEGTGPCTVRLDFGDGNSQRLGPGLPAEARHTYGSPGRYTIAAVPERPCVERRTATIEVRHTEQREITGISVDAPAGAPPGVREITVHGSGRCSYTLDFGDGNSETRDAELPDRVRHNYPAAGRYTAVATARPPCQGTQRWTFEIRGAAEDRNPDGRISRVTVRPESVRVGEPVTIEIAGSGPCRFVVDFHDGESRTLSQRLPYRLTHQYRSPGEYTIVVWAHQPCTGGGDPQVRVRRRDAP